MNDTMQRKVAVLRVFDAASVVVAAVMTLAVIIDLSGGGRVIVATVFALFVPGWTILRLAGFGVDALTLVAAFVLSMVVMIVVSLLMATVLGWPWRAATVSLGVLCVAGLAIVIADRRPHPTVRRTL